MRYGCLSAAALLTGACLAFGQTPVPSPEPLPPPAPTVVPGGEMPALQPGCWAGEGFYCPEYLYPDARPVYGPEPRGRFWVSAEYLLWWIKNQDTPPLVTTGPATFPVGFLGNPGTVVLFGGDDAVDHDAFSGARFRAGAWLNDCRKVGVEGSLFFLGERADRAVFSSPSVSVLARPFFNLNLGTQFSEFAAFPGVSTGSIAIENTSELWGGGGNLRCNLCCWCIGRADLLGGFQYLDLRESLSVVEAAAFAPGGPFPELAGSSFVATDRFATRNQFYGGQVGIDAITFRGPWFVNFRGTVGLGATHQVVDIQGEQRILTAAGVATAVPGGLLALPGANAGRRTDDDFSVVPQLNLNVGYQLTSGLRAFVGYNFLYWSSVVRPGDQIDPVVDVTRIPNFPTAAAPLAAVRPVNPFNTTDFWAHGLNFGLAFAW